MLDNNSRYVYEVYKLKSVSLAAKKLYISQPALSAAIKKAEKSIGAPVFNRKTFPFTLTPEGKIYIDAIEKMLLIEQKTRQKIDEFADIKSGTLRIGVSTHLSYFALPKICRLFHEKYPQIEISIEHTDSTNLLNLLKQNRADLVFTSFEADEEYNTVSLFEENYIVIMPEKYNEDNTLSTYSLSYDEIINRSYPNEKKIKDMSIFHGIEFIYAPHNTNIYKKRKILFGESGINPFITSPLTRQQLNYNLMLAGLGALFTTDAVAITMGDKKGLLYFAIASDDAKQSFNIVYPANNSSPTAKIVSEFADISQKLFNTENPIKALTFM